MRPIILIVAGIAFLWFFGVYWRFVIFLSMTLLYVGLHNPLVIDSGIAVALMAVLFWALRLAAPRKDSN